jgi:hypothetical protein
MSFNIAEAENYVNNIDISDARRWIIEQGAEEDAGKVFSGAKDQAQVVGSGLFAFAKGVDADVREAISASALLAQLVANKRASAESQPLVWFSEYSKVLQNVGWTLQSKEWTDYTAKGQAVEVNEKIVEVMTAALGPSKAALAILATTVKALKAMNSSSSWFTIFNRESQKAEIARFQVGLVENGRDSDVFISLLGCLIQARSEITQVLFFKFRNANASFKANSHKVSIDRQSLTDLKGPIRDKIKIFQSAYLSTITDL